MTSEQWKSGRKDSGLTQAQAARALNVSQAYLSQLEKGLRTASAELARNSATLYRLPPTALPITEGANLDAVSADDLHRQLASLGYPGFEHVQALATRNPAEVVLTAIVKPDLDARLVEALPWVLSMYTDLTWNWLRDRAKLQDAQNRLGYVVHLAKETARELPNHERVVNVLSQWQEELEQARLVREGTLCRDSMPERERLWLRANRPPAAEHWNLLTSLTPQQLSYAAH